MGSYGKQDQVDIDEEEKTLNLGSFVMTKMLGLMTKRDKEFLGLSLIFSVIQVWLNLRIPKIMGGITTLLSNGNADHSSVISAGLSMLFYAALSLMASSFVVFLSARISCSLGRKLRNELFHKIMSFSQEETAAFGSSSLITRCTGDVVMIEQIVSAGVQIIFYAPAIAVFAIIMMSGTNLIWTVVTLVLLMSMTMLMYFLLHLTRDTIINLQKKTDTLNRVNREHIEGLKIIHAFNAYEYQRKRSLDAIEDLNESVFSLSRITSALLPLGNGIGNLLGILIYTIGAYVIQAAAVTERVGLFSDMVVFSSFAALATMAIMQIVMVYIVFMRGMASQMRIIEVLDKEVRIKDSSDEKCPLKTGTIEFKNVSFRYPGAAADTLKNITFKINKGETVALIGATGCGKTSIMNLIPRMYDVSDGEVLVDGVDVRDYKLAELRSRIGYVPQKSILFSGTIAQNIDFAEGIGFQRTLSHIREAARVGQADSFIEKREGQYYARVEQGGSNFSGGQRQRLNISRAISRDPEIYLFDDSFSALDFETDRRLRKALRESSQNATVLMVAQRIQTIKNADRILVLDKGMIVGEGRHEELLSSCRVYKEIAMSQLPREVGTK